MDLCIIKDSNSEITPKEFVHNFLKDVNSTAYEVVINIENPVIDYFEEDKSGYEIN